MEVQEAQKQLDALETLSSKNLKQVLAEHSVGFEGVVEKEELIRLARRALTDLIGANAEPESPGSADVLRCGRHSKCTRDAYFDVGAAVGKGEKP